MSKNSTSYPGQQGIAGAADSWTHEDREVWVSMALAAATRSLRESGCDGTDTEDQTICGTD